jgi:hypothetical protein
LGNFIQRLFQNNLARKVRSIKNEQDLIRLFEHYLLQNQTTKDEVVGFLRSNHISFKVYRSEVPINSLLESDYDKAFDEIIAFLVGPTVWDGLLPFGSQYQVRFDFIGNILSTMKATLIVYDV